ncbi:3-hydroxybutyryl-CoA dehydrogenase [Dyadobacter sp. SG02]|uniref:3-hydroxyacyl-CoA dehydrogenase NAD-binding domain-containing protein n=1 Tax=Dyadobacter sp. SG02 TaxID=1855291 RepID=UPI0008D82883|nr:3-hydroxyacyl-CoA dehydrogenase NAD-binding domain-containing protein [Dyadobacter sp. SG02]SEJ58690.1 3-hydroxybutyryl-CoA dehydrogenase [Dyadobacter sp. SG02]
MKESNEAALLLGGHRIAAGIEKCLKQGGFSVLTDLNADPAAVNLVILVTAEDQGIKQAWIKRIEEKVPAGTLIAVNTESIGLDILQENALHPGRIIGLNWTEPADQTYFLEMIANETTNASEVTHLEEIARTAWNKDPYVIRGNAGIRMRLLGALIREAFFLVQNGYANAEDIDRACRNDAGYYLPFAGNLRYMDLMGTYAYGMVMKDLNRELATDTMLPGFFTDMVGRGDWGMDELEGFYRYKPGEASRWRELLGKFSQEIHELIGQYNHSEEAALKNGSN